MSQPLRVHPQFSEVPDDPAQTAPPSDAATAMIALALRALSQRAITAAASLFALLTVASAFWLGLQIAANPTPYQLACFALYLCFIIGVNVIVRRK